MDSYAFAMLVGLTVRDDEAYSKYRSEIAPILERYGGVFRRDYRVSESLAGGPAGVNRVFVLAFPSRGAKEAFFSDPAYRETRERYFDDAVAETDIAEVFAADD